RLREESLFLGLGLRSTSEGQGRNGAVMLPDPSAHVGAGRTAGPLVGAEVPGLSVRPADSVWGNGQGWPGRRGLDHLAWQGHGGDLRRGDARTRKQQQL